MSSYKFVSKKNLPHSIFFRFRPNCRRAYFSMRKLPLLKQNKNYNGFDSVMITQQMQFSTLLAWNPLTSVTVFVVPARCETIGVISVLCFMLFLFNFCFWFRSRAKCYDIIRIDKWIEFICVQAVTASQSGKIWVS